jgi:ribosomal 50S subunit-recycling heat shock protein
LINVPAAYRREEAVQAFFIPFIATFRFLHYNTPMRIDKFLNCVNITKRRAVSEDMCKNGVVSINGAVAKPAKAVKVGDKITITYLEKEVSYEVLAIPQTKTIPKTQQSVYVKELG